MRDRHVSRYLQLGFELEIIRKVLWDSVDVLYRTDLPIYKFDTSSKKSAARASVTISLGYKKCEREVRDLKSDVQRRIIQEKRSPLMDVLHD